MKLVITMLILGFGFSILCRAQGTREVKEQNDTLNWANIGYVGSVDFITKTHITNLLELNGVTSFLEGSVIDRIWVHQGDYDKAIEILKKDLEKMNYWIKLGETQILAKSKPEELIFNKPYCELLIDYPEETAVGSVLRNQAVKEDFAVTYKHVKKIDIVQREYINKLGKLEAGYEMTLEMIENGNDDEHGCKIFFQVWEQNKNVFLYGSNTWKNKEKLNEIVLGMSVNEVIEKLNIAESDIYIIKDPPLIYRGINTVLRDSTKIGISFHRTPASADPKDRTDDASLKIVRHLKINGFAWKKKNGKSKIIGSKPKYWID